jgi:hypothetical protein
VFVLGLTVPAFASTQRTQEKVFSVNRAAHSVELVNARHEVTKRQYTGSISPDVGIGATITYVASHSKITNIQVKSAATGNHPTVLGNLVSSNSVDTTLRLSDGTLYTFATSKIEVAGKAVRAKPTKTKTNRRRKRIAGAKVASYHPSDQATNPAETTAGETVTLKIQVGGSLFELTLPKNDPFEVSESEGVYKIRVRGSAGEVEWEEMEEQIAKEVKEAANEEQERGGPNLTADYELAGTIVGLGENEQTVEIASEGACPEGELTDENGVLACLNGSPLIGAGTNVTFNMPGAGEIHGSWLEEYTVGEHVHAVYNSNDELEEME